MIGVVLGADRRRNDQLAGDAVIFVFVFLRQSGRACSHIVGEGTLVDPIVGSLIFDVNGSACAAAGLLQVLIHEMVI